MEEFQAIFKVAGKYGVKALGVALTNNPMVGEVAGDLFEALIQTENRIDERLSQIENQLAEVLEQSYLVALRSGLRTLLDVNQLDEPSEQRADIKMARRSFVEAASAARTNLQRIVAERYLILTAIMLDNPAAAQQAFDRFDLLVTEALFTYTKMKEDARRGKSSSTRMLSKRGNPPSVISNLEAIESMRTIISNLFTETAVFAELAGHQPRAQFLDPKVHGELGIDCGRGESQCCQAGVISATWKKLYVHESSMAMPISGSPNAITMTAMEIEVDLTAHQRLSQPVPVSLELQSDPVIPIGQEDVLGAGARELQIRVERQSLPYGFFSFSMPPVALKVCLNAVSIRTSSWQRST